MTLRELVQRASRGDARAAAAVADHCRFKLGMSYSETLELVRHGWPDVTNAAWDALMQEADWEQRDAP